MLNWTIEDDCLNIVLVWAYCSGTVQHRKAVASCHAFTLPSNQGCRSRSGSGSESEKFFCVSGSRRAKRKFVGSGRKSKDLSGSGSRLEKNEAIWKWKRKRPALPLPLPLLRLLHSTDSLIWSIIFPSSDSLTKCVCLTILPVIGSLYPFNFVVQ